MRISDWSSDVCSSDLFSAIFSRLTFMSHSPAALTWDRTYDPNMTFVINIGRDSQKSNRAGFPASSHHRRADASHHRERSATGEPYARSIRIVGDPPSQAGEIGRPSWRARVWPYV